MDTKSRRAAKKNLKRYIAASQQVCNDAIAMAAVKCTEITAAARKDYRAAVDSILAARDAAVTKLREEAAK